MGRDDAEQVHAETADEWRAWLAVNHGRREGVWLVSWRRPAGRPAMTYDAAVTEAIAVGWVDSASRTLDPERSMLWFAPRSARSAWSRTNKGRVEMLERAGRLTPAGRRAVEVAKANGMWSVLDDPEALIVPVDLAAALEARPGARATWEASPPGVRRAALASIALVRRPQTRARRISQIAEDAAAGRAGA